MIDTGGQTRLGLRRRDLFGKLYRQSPTVPLNRVVMASYITLKANKIVGIYRSNGTEGEKGGRGWKTTYRSNDRRTREGL